MRALLALGLAVLLSGCISTPDVAGSAGTDARPESVDTWFGFNEFNLVNESVGEGAKHLNWGWSDYVAGIPAPTWQTLGQEQPYYLLNATITATFQLQAVAATEAPARPLSRPQLTAWFGTETSTISHVFAAGPAAAVDESVTAVWEIKLPPGGLYVESREELQVRLGSYYAQQNVGGVYLDLAESHINITKADAQPAAVATETSGSDVLNVIGGACTVRDPAGQVDAELRQAATESFSIDVPENTVRIEVGGSSTVGDMDFWIEDPEGNDLAHALGSGSDERIVLGPDNIAGRAGTWTVYAYACSPTSGVLLMDWTVGASAAEAQE